MWIIFSCKNYGDISEAFHWRVPGMVDVHQCIGLSIQWRKKLFLYKTFHLTNYSCKMGARRLYYLKIEPAIFYVTHSSYTVLIYTKFYRKKMWCKFREYCTLLFETLPKGKSYHEWQSHNYITPHSWGTNSKLN